MQVDLLLWEEVGRLVVVPNKLSESILAADSSSRASWILLGFPGSPGAAEKFLNEMFQLILRIFALFCDDWDSEVQSLTNFRKCKAKRHLKWSKKAPKNVR